MPPAFSAARPAFERHLEDVRELAGKDPEGAARKLFEFFVLDPACGSGNFLYVALRLLLDLQNEVISFSDEMGVGRFFVSVTPAQLYGIETNEYAHELAQMIPLSGMEISSIDDMKGASKKIKLLGPKYVLVKGGHLEGTVESTDILFDGDYFYSFSSPRIQTKNTHGTGCTYSSAICAGLAKGIYIIEAVEEAKKYVTEAIRRSFNVGKGHGPLNHFWKFE